MKHRLKEYAARIVKGESARHSDAPRLSLLLRCLVLSLAVIVFLIWYFVQGPSSSYEKGEFDRRNNAVWAQHAWSQERRTPEEVRRFVETLGAGNIRYVYLHVGPIESDGTIPRERYAQLGQFLNMARVYSDRIVYIPWLGQIRSKLPLDSVIVRRNIVATAKIFVEEFDMEGVHFDIEPIVDNDSDFLFLLEDVRMALGSEKIISVALAEYIPRSVLSVAKKFIKVGDGLSKEYMRKIDSRVDQLVIMTYENSIRSGALYRYFLKNEMIWLTNLGLRSKLIIGLPTYDTESDTFHPQAENINFGLQGVIEGLRSWRSELETFEGIALYGYWTTDADEWKTLQTLFLK